MLLNRLLFLVIAIISTHLDEISAEKTLQCLIDSKNPRKCIFDSVEIRTGDEVNFTADGNGSITTIDFKASTVESIPLELFEAFPELTDLWIVGHNLEAIQESTFENATNLRNLYLNYHKIQSLGNASFVGAKNMTMLHICCGKLSEVQEGAFSGLDELEILIMGRNQISKLPKNIFWNTTKLTKLYLDFNQLVTLDDDIFNSLVDLHWIKLNDNRLEVISDKLFINNSKLEIIELNNNRLSFVAINTFSHLTLLNQLMLSGNDCVDKDFTTNVVNQTLIVQKNLEPCTFMFLQYVKLSEKLDQVLIENREFKESISVIANGVKELQKEISARSSLQVSGQKSECVERKSDFDCVSELGENIRTLQDKICFIA